MILVNRKILFQFSVVICHKLKWNRTILLLLLLLGVPFAASGRPKEISGVDLDAIEKKMDEACSTADYQTCRSRSLQVIKAVCGGNDYKSLLAMQEVCESPTLVHAVNAFAVASYQLGEKQDAIQALFFSRRIFNIRAKDEFSDEPPQDDEPIHRNASRMEFHYRRWGDTYAIKLLSHLLISDGYSVRALDVVEQVRPPWSYLRERSSVPKSVAGIFQLSPRNSQHQESLHNGSAIKALKTIAKERNLSILVYFLNRSDVNHNTGQKISIPPVLYVWLVKPSGDFFKAIPLPKDLGDSNQVIEMLGYHDELSKKVRSPSELSLKKLYALFIEPISHLLNDEDNGHYLTIIPYGQLDQIPFAALVDSSGQPFIARHAISYAESISSLLEPEVSTKLSTQKPLRNLAVGNPILTRLYRRRSYHDVHYSVQPPPFPQERDDISLMGIPPFLPNAVAELKEVAGLLHGQVYQGEQATIEVVLPLLTKADVVHFATHALQDYDKEIASPGLPSGALMLTPSKNLTNGLLSSRDIYQHVVTNARLVNLSACSSGIGNRAGPEQLMKGLAHSFLVAGSQSVLYSLWDVPDAATYALMRDFYQLWYRQGLSRPVALQRAMLNVRNRREYANHFFWGAYKLVGTSFQDIR